MQRSSDLYQGKRAYAVGNQMRTSALSSISVGKAPLIVILALLFAIIMMSLTFVDDAQAEQLVADSIEAQVTEGDATAQLNALAEQADKDETPVIAPEEIPAPAPVPASNYIVPQAVTNAATQQSVWRDGQLVSLSLEREPGETVVFDAGERDGWAFTEWKINDAPDGFYELIKDDLGNPYISFTMPDHTVILEAQWMELEYVDTSINFGGSTDGKISAENNAAIKDLTDMGNANTPAHLLAAKGMLIIVDAGTRPGFVFSEWTIEAGSFSVTFTDRKSKVTSFSIPANIPSGQVVKIAALWKQAYLVTVNQGFAGSENGAGYYGEGDTVRVNAGTNPDSTLRFAGWVVTCDKAVALSPSPDASQVSFTMPAASVTMTATWTKLGVVSNTTDTKNNFLSADFVAKPEDLLKQVFAADSDEMKAVENKESISIWLVTKELKSDAVSTEDRSLINAAMGADNKLATYFDVSVYGKVTGGAEKKVTETAQRVEIKLTLPYEPPYIVPSGYTRTYKIICLHSGNTKTATLITPTYKYDNASKTGTLTFLSNQFSTYAIVYQDVKTSGDGNNNNNNSNNNSSSNVDSGLSSGSSSSASSGIDLDGDGIPDTGDVSESTPSPVAPTTTLLIALFCGVILGILRRTRAA